MGEGGKAARPKDLPQQAKEGCRGSRREGPESESHPFRLLSPRSRTPGPGGHCWARKPGAQRQVSSQPVWLKAGDGHREPQGTHTAVWVRGSLTQKSGDSGAGLPFWGGLRVQDKQKDPEQSSLVGEREPH